MKDNHTAYRHARKMDVAISKLLTDHPITPDNLMAWQVFHRTLQTTLDILKSLIAEQKK